MDVGTRMLLVDRRLIAAGLSGEEGVILAAETHQLLVSAHLDDTAVLEDDDLVGVDGAGESVGDEDRDLALCKLAELIEDLLLCESIERGGRLIEDEYLRLLIECAGDRELLPLTARELDARLLEDACERCIIPIGELGDKAVGVMECLSKALKCPTIDFMPLSG